MANRPETDKDRPREKEYDDHVEITNPGRLLFDKSKFGKLSVARNPVIFDACHRLGLTERIGSGIGRMKEVMAAQGLEIEFDPGEFFIVTFSRPETTRTKGTSPQVTPHTPYALSGAELQVLRFCKVYRSRLEITNFTGMNPDYIRKEIIPKLIEKGFLDLTIPGKPRSPNQKYVLTEAGRKRLEESESMKT